jgi:hypothetical protein|tara:strand:+ start:835 stop:1128 length:294 start_codon:yes stop_codon:yes gene_type:complete
MSEIKFTEEELKAIRGLQQRSNELVNKFGQLSIAKINLEKQSEQIEEQEFQLHSELEKLKKDEAKSIDEINEKYGAGTLNPDTGIFTPNVQPTDNEK